MKRFFLGAYWSARPDSLEDCSDRLSRLFSELAICDRCLAQWYELAGSRQTALEKPADVGDSSYRRKLLKGGRHWSDIPRKVMKDLGFSFDLWNGRDDPQSVGLHITCGSYYEALTNCVTLDLPDELGALKDVQRMRAVLAAVANAWEPDWAGVMSNEAMDKRNFDAANPFVDWMLYVCDKWLPSVPTFEPPATADRLATGTVVVVQQEPPDPDDPAHLENINQVRATLQRRVSVGG